MVMKVTNSGLNYPIHMLILIGVIAQNQTLSMYVGWITLRNILSGCFRSILKNLTYFDTEPCPVQ